MRLALLSLLLSLSCTPILSGEIETEQTVDEDAALEEQIQQYESDDATKEMMEQPSSQAEESFQENEMPQEKSIPEGSSLKTDEISELKKHIENLEGKVSSLEKELGSQKSGTLKTNSLSPGTKKETSQNDDISSDDPDVRAVMEELNSKGIDDLKQQMGSENDKEALAMAKARKTAGTLESGDVQREFDNVKKLYNEAINPKTSQCKDKAKCESFKAAADAFINKNQDHSHSRSVMLYKADALLGLGDYKAAQTAYARVYKGDEDGPHAADALLGLSHVFIKEKKKDAAIKFLEKIQKDFNPENLSEDTKQKFQNLSKECGVTLALKHKKEETKGKTDTKKEDGKKEAQKQKESLTKKIPQETIQTLDQKKKELAPAKTVNKTEKKETPQPKKDEQPTKKIHQDVTRHKETHKTEAKETVMTKDHKKGTN